MSVSGARKWSLDDEIMLFNLVCDYKPAGKNKHRNMVQIIDKINKHLSPGEEQFTASDIWDKLELLYNLERVDQIEEVDTLDETKKDSEPRLTPWHKPRTRSQVAETSEGGDSDTRKRAEERGLQVPVEKESPPDSGSEADIKAEVETSKTSSNKDESTSEDEKDKINTPEATASNVKKAIDEKDDEKEDDSEDDDDDDDDDDKEDQEDDEDITEKKVEEDETKVKLEEAPEEAEAGSKRITRGASRRAAVSDVESTPKPLIKKRTRSVSKQTSVEETPATKRRKTASPVPLTPAAKRRTRSTDTAKEPEESEPVESEPPKRRRSTRASVSKEQTPKTPVRRSTRRK